MPQTTNPDGTITVTDDVGNVITKDRFGNTNVGPLLQESETRRLEQQASNSQNTASSPPNAPDDGGFVQPAPPAAQKPQAVDVSANKAGNSNNSASIEANTPAATNALQGFQTSQPDLRIRIRARPGTEEEAYGNNDSKSIMAPLHVTEGLLFPYTPTISWSQEVDYTTMQTVHSNQDFSYYTRTPSTKFTIIGPFTSQNAWEARYSLAVIHFLRSNTKMYFGQNDDKRGLPPPIFLLDGYGDFMFNSLPIIINNYTIELNQNIDYVPVDLSLVFNDLLTGGSDNTFDIAPPPSTNVAWVPTNFNITISCTVQNTPNRWRKEFNLQDFRNGKLLGTNNKGWI